jgi:hypothetical protein
MWQIRVLLLIKPGSVGPFGHVQADTSDFLIAWLTAVSALYVWQTPTQRSQVVDPNIVIEQVDVVRITILVRFRCRFTFMLFHSHHGSAFKDSAAERVCRLQGSVAMAADSDFFSVGQQHTEDGKMIVWQVSLFRINNDITLGTDWRDASVLHSCIMEAAYQAKIGHVTIPDQPPVPEGESASEHGGDWSVDLQQWTQQNTKTTTLRHIRRCVVTGPRTT